jgi:hypothetical protein
MDTKSAQLHISIDMRLGFFCNNCPGKEASSDISDILMAKKQHI